MPLNRENIYTWLKQQIIENLKKLNPGIDFDELGNLKKLFAVEINSFKKTYADLLGGEDSSDYKKLLAQELMKIKQDLDKSSIAFTRYFASEKNKLLIIVLDNCDKRKLEDQLLMFEVASWTKETYKCLVFLPLRDTTFDNFRKEPPLDTVIKDFVFRIDPPLLKEVIMARVKYALREMSRTSNKLSFNLPNGITVEYPSSDQGFYLASIVRSLFENVYFSRLITGLAGRDIRKGLEIFLDFCKSGHLNETEIFKIRQQKGNYALPNHLISRIILRGNMKFYSDKNAIVKNLFSCFPEDVTPNPFVRLSILRWLKENFRKTGPTKNIGYHKISTLVNELVSAGHSDDRLVKEIEFLIRNRYVITESQDDLHYEFGDLISIAPSGHTLLELLNDITYLAACSEDIYYKESQVAELIQKRITEKFGAPQYSLQTTIENSKDLLNYLERYKNTFLLIKPQTFLKDEAVKDFTNLSIQKEIVQKIIDNNENLYKQTQYPHATVIEGDVVSVKDYGIFIEFGLDATGFVHVSEFNYTDLDIDDVEVGDVIRAKVKRYNSEHHKYDLELLDGIESFKYERPET